MLLAKKVKKQVFKLALVVCVLLLIATSLRVVYWPQTFATPIYINNNLLVLNKSLTLKELQKKLKLPDVKGRLLDVDGQPLKLNFPVKPVVKVVNGKSKQLTRNAKVTVKLFQQQTEPLKTVIKTFQPPTVVTGNGVFAFLSAKGQPGKKELKVGQISKKLVSAKFIMTGQPAVVTRSDVALAKVIALTFDDGPFPPFTNQIMEILKQQQIKATFFIVGRQAALFPDLIKQLTKAGFLLGNHSFSHSHLGNAPDVVLEQELEATKDLIVKAGGKEPRWFRPPYGSTSDRLAQLAAAKGYRVVSWNVDSQDWTNKDATAVVNQVVSGVKPGAIVLLHDGGGDRSNTVGALPRIIQTLKDQGYKFVTLDELVGTNW